MKSSMILNAANALPKERIAFFFGFLICGYNASESFPVYHGLQ